MLSDFLIELLIYADGRSIYSKPGILLNFYLPALYYSRIASPSIPGNASLEALPVYY
jgi:hypothetical protein